MRRVYGMAALVAVGLLLADVGCGGDGENNAGSGASSGTATAQGGAQSGGGGSTGTFSTSGPGGSGGDDSCASVEQEATLTSRPVDIIVAIDNSGSMSGEIEEVEVQMTRTFATILDGAVPAIDYSVILVSEHGDFSSREICISAPLGAEADADMDGHCDNVPNVPQDNPPKFYHHSVSVGSHNALCHLYDSFTDADQHNLHPNGYAPLLRDDSYKFFLVITDDRPEDCGYNDQNSVAGGEAVADAWDADMLALSPTHFGADAMNRNYTFWSIVSLAPYMPSAGAPYGDPHPPDTNLAPIITTECNSGAQNPGTGYQALSVLTDGYRYPTCPADENANPQGDYAALFTLMAQGVIEGAQVSCEIAIPDPPQGQTIDMNTLGVVYSSNDMFVEEFTRVNDAGDCDAHSFYVENNNIVLCPEACNVVQGDDSAKLTVSYDCGGPPA